MNQNKTKAIVLKSIPFKDGQSILTLLSEDRGLINMIVKGLSKRASSIGACATPLSEAEFVFSEGRSDLLKCHSASLINPHLALRDSYSTLMAGADLAKAILSSQYPGQESQSAYLLFSSFLKQLPRYRAQLDTFICSFLLKLLKMEGLLDLSSILGMPTQPNGDYSIEDLQLIESLINASSFANLSQIDVKKEFKDKIQKIFDDEMKR